MKIAGRTFVVSGGASGLGRACVESLVAQGAGVAILDLSDDGQDFATALGPAAWFHRCDVRDSASVAKAVDGAAAWARETGRPLGGVIPAAGVATPATVLGRDGAPLSLDDVDFVLDVNIRGVIDVVRQAAQHIARADADADGERGVVVMVASSAAFDGQKGQVAYAASKGAVASMTLPMARDLARFGIRCVTVAPSLFETRMTSAMSPRVRKSLEATYEFPLRAGRPDEFAQLVRQCIENSMLNGAVIRIDGGSRPNKI